MLDRSSLPLWFVEQTSWYKLRHCWLYSCRMVEAAAESRCWKPNCHRSACDGYHRRFHVWVQAIWYAVNKHWWFWLELTVHMDWHFWQRETTAAIGHCSDPVCWYYWRMLITCFWLGSRVAIQSEVTATTATTNFFAVCGTSLTWIDFFELSRIHKCK